MMGASPQSAAQPNPLDASETHISTLFFARDRVYKLLRPVATGFLDHRDPSVRCAAATREYELNERIAPDVYLGTADVVEDGELVDRMIVMKRLPSTRSVTALWRSGELTEHHIRDIARTIAAFHAALPPEPFVDDAVDTQRLLWANNIKEMEPFVGQMLGAEDMARVTELFSSWLDSHGELLAQRVTDGNIRDGHGDLLADDIFCLDDGPAILDCLAFRDDLRQVDVLDDVAFLAMDLHRLAGPAWAQLLLKYYGEFSGEHHPGSLAHFYVAYRALVRCKIACLRAEGGEPQFAAAARMYQRLCLDQLERARLRIILVGGGPSTGKTTLATALGEQFGCAVLSTDELRKDLAAVERTEHHFAEPDAGLYSDEHTERTYDELLRQAEVLLRSGETVILDASWTRDQQRTKARAVAADRGAELIPIECHLPVGIAKERLIRRLADPTLTSDATPEIVDHLNDTRDPWPDAIRIDCNQGFLDVESSALTGVRSFGRKENHLSRHTPGSFWGVVAIS
jgi:aminoglycoside phosphotransferase family enzyme/predicted kinase